MAQHKYKGGIVKRQAFWMMLLPGCYIPLPHLRKQSKINTRIHIKELTPADIFKLAKEIRPIIGR
ncbi:MAG: hypothetical protein V3U84_07580 [Thiotrichaceae bacterium]